MSRERLLAAIKAKQQNNIVKAAQQVTIALSDNTTINKTIVGIWCSNPAVIKNGIKAADYKKHDFIFYLSADKRYSLHINNGKAVYISPNFKTKVKTIKL